MRIRAWCNGSRQSETLFAPAERQQIERHERRALSGQRTGRTMLACCKSKRSTTPRICCDSIRTSGRTAPRIPERVCFRLCASWAFPLPRNDRGDATRRFFRETPVQKESLPVSGHRILVLPNAKQSWAKTRGEKRLRNPEFKFAAGVH
jgi:hypothetical protein